MGLRDMKTKTTQEQYMIWYTEVPKRWDYINLKKKREPIWFQTHTIPTQSVELKHE